MQHPTKTHSIRLHGPWRIRVLKTFSQPDTTRTAGESAKCKIPGTWSETLGDTFRGVVEFGRFFRSPTGLNQHQKVWLIVDKVDQSATVVLNGQSLGKVSSTQSLQIEVQGILKPKNQLVVTIEKRLESELAGAGGLIGSVRLRIEVA